MHQHVQTSAARGGILLVLKRFMQVSRARQRSLKLSTTSSFNQPDSEALELSTPYKLSSTVSLTSRRPTHLPQQAFRMRFCTRMNSRQHNTLERLCVGSVTMHFSSPRFVEKPARISSF